MPATRVSDHSQIKRSNSVGPGKKVNTACAACKQRRVRCDRRDGDVEVCTACAERGFQCVDDDGKAKKVLRRGRKIQELEAIYGRNAAPPRSNPSATGSSAPSRRSSASARHSTAVKILPAPLVALPLKPLGRSFFTSNFFKRLYLQFPILDPADYTERYLRYLTKGVSLEPAGALIAQTLYAWASSFGFDEDGCDATVDSEDEEHAARIISDDSAIITRRKNETNMIVKSILKAIDVNAVLRTVSWDGVSVLLLLLPLTRDVLSEFERKQLHQVALSQAYALSGVAAPSNDDLPEGPTSEVVRARIFWYAHVNEGLSSALNGTKLVFDQDDVSSFRTSLTSTSLNETLLRSPITSDFTYHHTIAPIRLAAICRSISHSITGPSAQRSSSNQDAEAPVQSLHNVWEALDSSWLEFDRQRQYEETDDLKDVFVSAWQIVIYAIHNIVREALWDHICASRQSTPSPRALGRGLSATDALSCNDNSNGSGMHGSTTAKTRLRDLMALHDEAESRCNERAPQVIQLLRRHQRGSLLLFDADFVQKGVVFAAEYCVASTNTQDGFHTCLTALSQMRWAFASGQQQIKRLSKLWNSRRETDIKGRRKASKQSVSESLYTGIGAPFPSLSQNLQSFPTSNGHVRSEHPSIQLADNEANQNGTYSSSPVALHGWGRRPTAPANLEPHFDHGSAATTPRRSASIATEADSQSSSPSLSQDSLLGDGPEHPEGILVYGGGHVVTPSHQATYNNTFSMMASTHSAGLQMPSEGSTSSQAPPSAVPDQRSSFATPPSIITGLGSYSGPSSAGDIQFYDLQGQGAPSASFNFDEVHGEPLFRSTLGLSAASFSPTQRFSSSVDALEYMRATSLFQAFGSNPTVGTGGQYFTM